MEKGLRECCRSVRIGKMLLLRDEDTGERHVGFKLLLLEIHNENHINPY